MTGRFSKASSARLDLAETLVDLVRQLIGFRVFSLDPFVFLTQGFSGRALVIVQIDEGEVERPQPLIEAIGQIGIDGDPLPALGGDFLGEGLELLRDQAVEKRGVLKPAASIGLEEIAQHAAARLLIGFDADEQGALVGGRHRGFSEQLADIPGLAIVGGLDRLPDLLLAGMVGIDGEGHQLFELHAVLGIDVEERGRDRGQTQALFHHLRGREEGRSDLLLAHALAAHVIEGPELIERMQRHALGVFGEAVVLGENRRGGITHDAGHRRGPGETLLLHEDGERLIAATAGGNFIHVGLIAPGVEDRADIEALEERASAGDVLGQFLDRDAGLDASDIRLAEHELVEGDVAGRRQDDFLGGSSHRGSLRDGRREPLSRPEPVTKIPTSLSLCWSDPVVWPGARTERRCSGLSSCAIGIASPAA